MRSFQELIPLIFGFELPIMSQNIDATCPYVVKIQEQYKVQVMFKTRPKLHATLVLVKGVEWEVDQVKHATLLLIEYICDSLAVSREFKVDKCVFIEGFSIVCLNGCLVLFV